MKDEDKEKRKRLPDGRFPPGQTATLQKQLEELKAAVTELLTKSPLLKGCPHEGSVTGALVKKVLEAMK